MKIKFYNNKSNDFIHILLKEKQHRQALDKAKSEIEKDISKKQMDAEERKVDQKEAYLKQLARPKTPTFKYE